MDVRAALKLGIARLHETKISSHTLAAELLLLHATGRTRRSLYSHPEDELSNSQSQSYVSLLEQRAAGVPVQHLTGKQEFWGLEFEVTPDVLIPRPETEHVIEVALDRLALPRPAFEERPEYIGRRIDHRRHWHRLRLHRHRTRQGTPLRKNIRARYFSRCAKSCATQRHSPRCFHSWSRRPRHISRIKFALSPR